jgi:hypothetical protein
MSGTCSKLRVLLFGSWQKLCELVVCKWRGGLKEAVWYRFASVMRTAIARMTDAPTVLILAAFRTCCLTDEMLFRILQQPTALLIRLELYAVQQRLAYSAVLAHL